MQLKPLTAVRACLFLALALAVNATLVVVGAQNVTTSPVSGGGMSGQAIVTVSAAVVALTQLLKFAQVINDRRGPIGVLVLALAGVAFWGWTTGDVSRATAFAYFAGWIAVATSAAGVFGFTRAAPDAVTGTKSPPAPPGAGANTTV